MQPPPIWIACPITLLLIGWCLPSRAETVAHADLRTGSPEPIDYYVVICARESDPWGAGHTFVVWVQQDRRTGEAHSQGFGFYPEVERVMARLFMRDGAVRDESTKPASTKPWLLTHRLILQVNRDAFESSLKVMRQWGGSEVDFQLLKRNCTHFTHDVLRAIQPGVPGPQRGERPSAYVNRLMMHELGQNRTRFERLPAIFVAGDQ